MTFVRSKKLGGYYNPSTPKEPQVEAPKFLANYTCTREDDDSAFYFCRYTSQWSSKIHQADMLWWGIGECFWLSDLQHFCYQLLSSFIKLYYSVFD
jgi:hypothetical protein